MKVIVTHTDTFCGEFNGSWVRRYEFMMPKDKMTTRSAVIRAKKLTGLTNHRSRSYDYGDSITIRPAGRNEMVVVEFQ